MPNAHRRRRRLVRRLRRAWAEAAFFGRALRVLVRPLTAFVIAAAIGTVVEHHWGAPAGEPPPPWDKALFDTYALLMGEVTGSLPADPWAQVAFYLLPLVGIVFVAEGVLKLGFEVFDKRQNAGEWTRIMAKHSRGHVVVCGLGTVGIRVVEELLGLDEQVYVIERDEHNEFIATARERGVEVLVGDARTENMLRSLNVERCRAVVIVTDDDLANLEIAMDVREIRADVPIILRLFDQRLAQKVRHTMGIQVSLSTSMVAAPLFASAALDTHVVGTHRVGDRLLLLVELAVGPRLAGKTPAKVLEAHGVQVVAVRRDGAWSVEVGGTDTLRAGDRVHVTVANHRIEEAVALEG